MSTYQTTNSTYGVFCLAISLSLASFPALAQDVTGGEHLGTPATETGSNAGAAQNLLSNVAAAFKAASQDANSVNGIDQETSPLSSSQHSLQTFASGAPLAAPVTNTQTEESFLTCPLDKLRSSYESVLADETTEVIDVLMVENEVLRICQARQSQINGILKITQSVEEVAGELLTKKINGMANEWSRAQAELHRAKLAEHLRQRNEVARIASNAAPVSQPSADGSKDLASTNRTKPSVDTSASSQHGSCRPDYRVTAIYGAGGKTRATVLSPEGAEHRVKVGDLLPFGVKIMAIGQGLVTIDVNGTRDVLAFDSDARTRSGPLAEEGFIVAKPGDPTDSAALSRRLTPAFELTSGSGE
ncbi:type IV pilus biogenesis protein PilP [Cognatishimia sp. D5M38]|uniref:Type IV pilus biogenesis protein PilP n=1 Tax=Cognatishimia coralii TaxID=3083254 RepID=A0ABU8QKS3_9RHOB